MVGGGLWGSGEKVTVTVERSGSDGKVRWYTATTMRVGWITTMGGRFGIRSKSTTSISRTGFGVIGFLGRLPTRLVLRNRLGQGTGVWFGGPPALKSDSMANRCHRAVPAFGRHFKRGDDW